MEEERELCEVAVPMRVQAERTRVLRGGQDERQSSKWKSAACQEKRRGSEPSDPKP